MQLKIAANLAVEAWYYNETFAAWEPLMESEETLSGRRLWQLDFKVCLVGIDIMIFIYRIGVVKYTICLSMYSIHRVFFSVLGI